MKTQGLASLQVFFKASLHALSNLNPLQIVIIKNLTLWLLVTTPAYFFDQEFFYQGLANVCIPFITGAIALLKCQVMPLFNEEKIKKIITIDSVNI